MVKPTVSMFDIHVLCMSTYGPRYVRKSYLGVYCQTQKTVDTWKISGMLIVYGPITVKFRTREQTSKPQTNDRCCLRFSYLAPYWLISHNTIQPRPQGFSLKKWVGREKALASAGHVYSLNIPEKLIYMQPAGFALTEVERSNNGK